MGEDLGQLEGVAGLSLENRSEPIMQVLPLRFRQRSISSVADEQGAESQFVGRTVAAAHQRLAPQRYEAGFRIRAGQVSYLLHAESLPDAAPPLPPPPLAPTHPIH